MGLFRRQSERVEERSFSFNQLGLMLSQAAGSGVVSDVHGALGNAAVWACIDTIASSVSALPLDSVRTNGTVRTPVSPQPSLLAAPSATVPLDVWLYQLTWSLLTDGNAFGIITATDARQWPTSIELVDPTVVRERKVANGIATAVVDTGEPQALWPFGPVFHVPGRMTTPGSPFALSPLEYAGRAIGAGVAAEKFALQFFTDGAHPTHEITVESEISEEQAEGIKAKVMRSTRGNREPIVHGSGVSISPVQSDMNTTEYLDLLRFEVEQVCRFYRVPPSMVYGAVSGQSVTYANVSQADLHYLKHSLDGYLVRIERALTGCLPRPQVVKFNRDALLRSDTLTRYQAHQIGLAAGFLVPNEVREMEDRPPMEEGDSPTADESSPDDAAEDAQEDS